MVTLSVVITAFNEEKKIEDCLNSIKDLVDEIILIDNSSIDDTSKIAKKFNAKVYKRPNYPMLNINKNFGFSKTSSEWILSLDADERVSLELKDEIKSTLSKQLAINDEQQNGYWIPRKNLIFGKWMQHTGWYPDYQLRLFRKGKGKFEEQHVHEMIKIDGKTNYLKNNLIHYNYESISQFLKKLGDIYAPNEADQLIKNGYEFDWKDAIRMPAKEFLSRFFARQGYKDGFHGLILSLLMAFYHLIVYINIWEKTGFEKIENKNILSETEKEIKTLYRNLNYWFVYQKIENTKSPLQKMLYRVWKKFH